MTEKQEEQMIKAAHKYWADKSGGYDKQEIMMDSFVEGYKQAFAFCIEDMGAGQKGCMCEKPILQSQTKQCGRCGSYIDRVRHIILTQSHKP